MPAETRVVVVVVVPAVALPDVGDVGVQEVHHGANAQCQRQNNWMQSLMHMSRKLSEPVDEFSAVQKTLLYIRT